MCVSYDQTARIWNTVTGECEAELKGHSSYINSAVFSPDGRHVVSASDDQTARIWNTATGECEAELKGHSSYVNSAVFSSDCRHIVSASFDQTARIWNTATGECEAELIEHIFFNNPQSLPDGIFASHESNGPISLSLQPSFLNMHQNIITHTKTLQNIWVPPTFCNPVEISHHLSKICLAYGSGDVLLLEVCIIPKFT